MPQTQQVLVPTLNRARNETLPHTQFAAWHAVAEEGIPFRDIAASIGKHLNLPVVSKSPSEVAKHFSFLSLFTDRDNPTSSQLTQQTLNWRPTHPTLLADLANADYFRP